jgi:hypothetical protein
MIRSRSAVLHYIGDYWRTDTNSGCRSHESTTGRLMNGSWRIMRAMRCWRVEPWSMAYSSSSVTLSRLDLVIRRVLRQRIVRWASSTISAPTIRTAAVDLQGWGVWGMAGIRRMGARGLNLVTWRVDCQRVVRWPCPIFMTLSWIVGVG